MKFRKETKSDSPMSTPTVVHHHQQSETGPIMARAIIVVAGLVLAWFVALYLVREAGAYKPEQTLARFLIWTFIILGLFFILQHWLSKQLDRWYEHKELLEAERTQQIRYKQLLTGSAINDTRTSNERQRLATLVYMIILDAYDHYAKSGPYRGSWRPWSRRPAGERVLVTLGETAPVGTEFGAKVRRFLETQGVIVKDQIDLETYPSIADVQRLLYQPVLLQTNGTPDSDDGRGASNWSIIE
jgi:hypothetical protein